MSAAVTTPGRAVRRQICAKHNVEYGQVYDPGIPGQREAYWVGNCRECENDIRIEQRKAEELAQLTQEIIAEVERRIAADADHEKRIRELAAADLEREVAEVVTDYCAHKRPQWETYHRNAAWNEIVAEVESEKLADIEVRLREVK